MHELERLVSLPTFEDLIENIKQNEKSKRIRKNENRSDEDFKDDNDNDNGDEEINFT